MSTTKLIQYVYLPLVGDFLRRVYDSHDQLHFAVYILNSGVLNGKEQNLFKFP